MSSDDKFSRMVNCRYLLSLIVTIADEIVAKCANNKVLWFSCKLNTGESTVVTEIT